MRCGRVTCSGAIVGKRGGSEAVDKYHSVVEMERSREGER